MLVFYYYFLFISFFTYTKISKHLLAKYYQDSKEKQKLGECRKKYYKTWKNKNSSQIKTD